MSDPKETKRPANPQFRAGLYGMGALYLIYLYYQIAKPFFTRDPYGPTLFQFALGTVVLGGGAVVLALLAWKIYRTPAPEAEEETVEESEE